MDQELFDALEKAGKKLSNKGRGTDISFADPTSGKIEIGKAPTAVSYTLKPLRDLYAAGTDSPTVDPENEDYMPLFLGIESEIAQYYQDADAALTDGSVGLTLDQLAMDPNSPPTSDPLTQRIGMGLRLTLSLNDFSRQEVRAALRKIRKSVERHSRVDGRRGYLDFIVEFYGSGK